jgi:predicted nucleic acid-binding protein
VIVSGDGHLLELGTWRGIAIRTLAAFLAELEAR